MKVVYVDEKDREVGAGSISKALEKGCIVRIARVFLFNDRGELLIQKRSDNHPSLPGRWDQTSAGHVDKGETYRGAALRELKEEMGITGVGLDEFVKFYTEEKDEAKVKKRFNMLFTGTYSGEVKIDEDEVSDYRWVGIKELQNEIERSPNKFTKGFIKTLQAYMEGPTRNT